MLFQEDSNRLVQAQHDLAASAALVASLPDEERSVLELRRQRWQEANDGFVKAVRQTRRDREETATARFELDAVGQLVNEWYTVTRSELNGRFTHPRPSDNVPKNVLAERQRAAATVASMAPSKFAEQAVDVRVAQLAELVHELQFNQTLAPLGLDPEFVAAAEAASAAKAAYEREKDEDSAAQAGLVSRRGDFDRLKRAYALSVEAALVATGRTEEIGRWLLARDASFRARRQANATLAEEPNATAVEALVGEPVNNDPAGPGLIE